MRFAPTAALAAVALLGLAACQDVNGPEPGPAAISPAFSQGGPDIIPGRFIVTVRSDVDPAGLASEHGVRPDFVYRHALNGFAGSISDAARSGLLQDARVLRVEPDQIAEAWGTTIQSPTPSWGLDRIDQHNLPLDNSYTYDTNASNVTAYIIDTGIRTSHTDFGGRASIGADEVGDGQNGNDCNGHGTHVAGTVGGNTYGVAKAVHLVAVRVLNCSGSGSYSGVIAGIDWVTQHHASPAVANMSLGGGASSSLDQAVENSIASGVAYAVAAGNGNFIGIAQDACKYSPARAPDAMTIGATNNTDTKASWSNYGDCVDWFAPGVSITSDWNSSNTATNTISGTSMATPHTTGVAALYLATHSSATPAQVRQALYDATSKGIVKSSNTANNDLLYSLFSGSPPPNQPPTASFTYSCTDLTCNFTDTSTDPDGSVVAWSWSFGGDGTSSAQNPSHTFTSGGTYAVTLNVTDNDGAPGQTSQNVTVTAPSGNQPPTASFTYQCTDLMCDFTDTSTDSDGSIASRSWDFGDGGTSTATNPSHTFGSAGTHTVTLLVTDNGGATDQTSQDVSVTAPPPSGITLSSATGYKKKGSQYVDLVWSGASSTEVDVYRDGVPVATIPNDSPYTDSTGKKGGGDTYVYMICEAGTSTCSNQVTVTF